MKVFVFDLLAYDANLDHLKNGWLKGLTPWFRCAPANDQFRLTTTRCLEHTPLKNAHAHARDPLARMNLVAKRHLSDALNPAIIAARHTQALDFMNSVSVSAPAGGG